MIEVTTSYWSKLSNKCTKIVKLKIPEVYIQKGKKKKKRLKDNSIFATAQIYGRN